MDDNNQLGSLDEMTKESFEKYPLQAPFAIKEYLKNVGADYDEEEDEDETEKIGDENYDAPDTVSWLQLEENDSQGAIDLKKKLQNVKYFNQFKIAITQTSLIVFLASLKTTTHQIVDFDKYCREYHSFTQRDDTDIYIMRHFYLSSLNAQEMGIGRRIQSVNIDENNQVDIEYEDDNNESEAVAAEILRAQKEYDHLIQTLLTQYCERKVFLKPQDM